MSDVLKYACFRTGSDYASKTSADLATAIVKPISLIPMKRIDFLAQAVAAGATRSELSPLYGQAAFMADLEAALTDGDLEAMTVLVAIGNDLRSFSQDTYTALLSVLAGNSLRLVDVVADELGELRPVTVSEADVNQALGR